MSGQEGRIYFPTLRQRHFLEGCLTSGSGNCATRCYACGFYRRIGLLHVDFYWDGNARRRFQGSHAGCIAVVVNVCTSGLFGLREVITLCLPNDAHAHATIRGIAAQRPTLRASC
jgi:hypothetical protein